MAMFGSMGAKRSPFDFKPQVYGTPGIGDGLPGATPMGGVGDFISPETRNILDTAPPAKAGFGARDVVGIIGDALSAMGGGQGVYTQMKLRERDTAQRLQMAQQQRQADMEDWRAKFDYERQFPKAVAPHYWETNDGSLGMIGPDGQPKIVFQDPTPKQETIQVRDPATGEVKWFKVPVGGGDPSVSPSPGGVPNRPAIGSVITDPRKAGAGSGQGGFRP